MSAFMNSSRTIQDHGTHVERTGRVKLNCSEEGMTKIPARTKVLSFYYLCFLFHSSLYKW